MKVPISGYVKIILSCLKKKVKTWNRKKQLIKAPQRSIYDLSNLNELLYTNLELEELLQTELLVVTIPQLSLRTRAKLIKQKVCGSLGYAVPKTFKRTQPRLPAQNLDIFTQQNNNLQIWNEDLDSTRRYVIIHLSKDHIIDVIKVINEKAITQLKLNKTNTLTIKHQAKMPAFEQSQLFS